MAFLGEFGRQAADYDGEADSFTFYGEQFEIPARLSGLVMLRFADQARGADALTSEGTARAEAGRAALARATTGEERAAAEAEVAAGEQMFGEGTSAGGAAQRRFLRDCLGEGQADRFEEVAMRVGAPIDELLYVAGMVYATVSGRPTQRPSSSSGGPLTTGLGSTDGAASPVATPGPSPLPEASVTDLSEAAAQRAEFAAQMQPVRALLSGD